MCFCILNMFPLQGMSEIYLVIDFRSFLELFSGWLGELLIYTGSLFGFQ